MYFKTLSDHKHHRHHLVIQRVCVYTVCVCVPPCETPTEQGKSLSQKYDSEVWSPALS